MFNHALVKFLCAAILAFAPASARAREAHFVFTADQHYGMSRPAFRGCTDVSADTVNAAMVEAINSLVDAVFPLDGGVMAGKAVGGAEYVISAGDIASKLTGAGTGPALTASQCWELFKRQYCGGVALKNSGGRKAEILAIPGNHEISTALGRYPPAFPLPDAGAMVGMFNRAHNASLRPEEYDFAAHKVTMARDLAGVRLLLVQLWPDEEARAYIAREIAASPADTPIILVCHFPPGVSAVYRESPERKFGAVPENTCGTVPADAAGQARIVELSREERRAFAGFIKQHPSIVAYFHGHHHNNHSWVFT